MWLRYTSFPKGLVIFNSEYYDGKCLRAVNEARSHLAKSLPAPTTMLKKTQTVFVPLSQLYGSFCTPDIEQPPFLCSMSVLSWCFSIEKINAFYLVFLYTTYKCI